MALTMLALRLFMHRHRSVALLIVMMALCLNAALPGGYMIEQTSKTLTVTVCHDSLSPAQTKQITIPMKNGGDPAGAKVPKSECPYSALAMAATGGADAMHHDDGGRFCQKGDELHAVAVGQAEIDQFRGGLVYGRRRKGRARLQLR